MNTELLRTFIEVSNTRHFGRAAETLCLTQSAVSFRIKQLEEHIGTALFIRQRNNIILTPAGERMLPHAQKMLTAWQLALQDVGAPSSKGLQIALGGTSNLWDSFLQSMLPSIARHIPGIQIRTEINSTAELSRSLLNGRLDIAVILDVPKMAEFESIAIGQIDLVLVASQSDFDMADIESLGYIFVDWGSALNLEHAKIHSKPVAPTLHTGQSHIALEFMLRNGGVALLPQALAQSYLERGQLFLVPDNAPLKKDVYAVFASQHFRSNDLNPVISLIKSFRLNSPTEITP